MKARLSKWRLFSIVAMLALVLSGCGEPFLSTLQPAGEVAQTQYDLMILATLIMVLVIIVVMVVYMVAIVRFRRKKGDTKIPKQVEGSHTLEIRVDSYSDHPSSYFGCSDCCMQRSS